jgi:D-3-phosphoglycerate dehydrogenase
VPSVVAPPESAAHRITHLHVNTPGVLATINQILGDHGANIEGQLLGTRGEFGYVITDISTACGPEMAEQLRAMPTTIRLRVLS